MARKGFFEDYQSDKQGGNARDRPALVRRSGLTAVISFFQRLFTVVLYFIATALSSVGLTVLINKPLRDTLIELVRSVFPGG